MIRRLFFLIEGNEDEDFITRIIVPIIQNERYTIKTWKYAGKPWKKTRSLLKTIRKMNGCCFFLRDLDDEPCVVESRKKLRTSLARITISVMWSS